MNLVLAFALLAQGPVAPILPAPYSTPSAAKFSRVIPWPANAKPSAPPGFVVERWADDLNGARWLYQLPNGDVLTAEARGRIILFRDTTGDGNPDERHTLIENRNGNLNRPFGMAFVAPYLYVANTNGLWRYPYAPGETFISPASGTRILDLPGDGHWTRNVIASREGERLYVTVGSLTNVDVEGRDARDPRRAAILEYDIATGTSRIYAGGLRNANGMDWEPVNGKLWTAVNERDGLGDDLVPDFVTSVSPHGFYGWPYFYFGIYEDPRKAGQRPDLAGQSIVPDLAVGAHTATLGLAFYRNAAFPERFRNGMFVAQHGSWNRAKFAGYRIGFVPFDRNGNVTGPIRDFVTGFIADEATSEVYGRPVCVIGLQDGSLLFTDDASNRIWRVRFEGPDATIPSLGGLMLFNASTDRPIEPLAGEASELVIDPARLGTDQLSIVAVPATPMGSVCFKLDGEIIRIENRAPFAIGGADQPDGRDDYWPWVPPAGTHTLEVTPFEGPDATGAAGVTTTVRFTTR